MTTMPSSGCHLVEPLTAAEETILNLLAQGLSDKEIGIKLSIAPITVRGDHKQNLYDKLGLHHGFRNRKWAVHCARQLGLLPEGDPVQDHAPPGDNPYKGLDAFQPEDAPVFFGREAFIERLLARLCQNGSRPRFLAVVGPSGSGKSSVIRAGLIPVLKQDRIPGARTWAVTTMFPRVNPFFELETALRAVAIKQQPDLLDLLQRDAYGLARAARLILPEDRPLLLLVDQFEENFTLVEDSVLARRFMDVIYAAVTDPRSTVRVIITLRADFLDRPLMYPDFSWLVQEHTAMVVPLTPDELERAITLPAQLAHVTIEPGLVARLVAEANEQPGALPLLEFALTELYDSRVGHTITMSTYEEIGGMQQALAAQADKIFAGLDDLQQAAARQLFLRLITLGEGTEDVRRRVPTRELASLDVPEETMDYVTNFLAANRLLTLDLDPATREPLVEVAHEALIREWVQLRVWLDESRSDVRMERSLAAAVDDWLHHVREAGYLLQGPKLAQFEGWRVITGLALTAEEHAFLDASITERDRQHRRRRMIRNLVLAAALAVAVVMAALAAFAFDRERQAQDARAASEANAAEAQELALVNGAQAALEKGDLDTALALALAANQLNPSSSRASVVLAEAAYAPGTARLFPQEQAYNSALSRDNTLLATTGYMGGGAPNPIHLWDPATGDLLRTFEGHKDLIMNIAFSQDARWILSSGADRTLRLWDTQTGEELQRFEYLDTSDTVPGVWGLAFSADGTRVYGTAGPYLVEWDTATGQIIRKMFFREDLSLLVLDLHPDGKRVMTTSWFGTWLLWDLTTGKPLHLFEHDKTHQAWLSGCLLADGHRAITTAADKTIILWNLETYEAIRHFEVPRDANPLPAACSPDGHRALTAGGTTNLWDVETGEEIPLIEGIQVPGADSRPLFFSDGQHILFGQADIVRVWDTQYGAELWRFTPPGDSMETPITSILVTPDERSVIAYADIRKLGYYAAGPFTVYDRQTGEEIRRFGPGVADGQWNDIGGMTLSHNGRMIAGGGQTGQIVVWDVTSGQQLWTLVGHTGRAVALAFSPDDRTLMSSSEDTTAILWDLSTGQVIRRFIGHDGGVWAVAVTPDGRRLVSGSEDKTLIVWDMATGDILHRLNGLNAWVLRVAVSPDGQRILSSTNDGWVQLWDLAIGQLIRTFPDPIMTNNPGDVAFDPSGRYAFVATYGGIYQWNTETGELVRRYPPSRKITFSADGRSFYSMDAAHVAQQIPSFRLVQYRFDTPSELVAWTYDHRYVRELTCAERALYHLDPGCDANGVYPTSTPYIPPSPSPTQPTTSRVVQIGPAPTNTPTVLPLPVVGAQTGDNRGEVAIGGYQVWHYAGRAGETIQISVTADKSCNKATADTSCLDTRLTVLAPHGELLTVSWANGNLLPGTDDIEPGVNSNSRVTDLVLQYDGDYTIEVSGSHFKTGGTYTLTIQSTPPEVVTPSP